MPELEPTSRRSHHWPTPVHRVWRMSEPGAVYSSKEARDKARKTAEHMQKLHSDAAQAAARDAGRRVFVYHTAWIVIPEANSALNLLRPGLGEDLGVAAMIEGVESQGWRLEHVVFSDRFTMFFRRMD